MARRFWPTVIMLAAGVALVITASALRPARSAATGAAVGARKGGTLRLGEANDVDFVDPALAYGPDSWLIEFATCAKLFNYPDESGAAGTRVLPEVVRTTRVSRDRRVYTFDLKRTFRFHTGAPVTA